MEYYTPTLKVILRYYYLMVPKIFNVRLIPKKGQCIKLQFKLPLPNNILYPDSYRGENVFYEKRFAVFNGGENSEILEVIYVEVDL